MKRNNQRAGREPDAITRLTRTQMHDLCRRIHTAVNGDLPAAGSRRLGPHQSVRLVLASPRHNLEQELLAELSGVSQPTVSRVLAAWTPLIAGALEENIPTADGLDPGAQPIVDGTLVPCWAWRDKPELYSGKHHTTGMNLQVACTLTGRLAWASDPVPGRIHDARALTESGLLDNNNDPSSSDPTRHPPTRHIADKGYVGLGLITPVKKLPGASPVRGRQERQPGHRPDQVADRTSHRQPQNLAHPQNRLQTPHRHPPGHHHSNTRNHIHLHPMNKPPCSMAAMNLRVQATRSSSVNQVLVVA